MTGGCTIRYTTEELEGCRGGGRHGEGRDKGRERGRGKKGEGKKVRSKGAKESVLRGREQEGERDCDCWK